MSASFVHLHAHTCYSLLDGVARVDDILRSTQAAGMPALALTDHGTMFGAIEFYSKAREIGVKPIIGCEVYVSDRPLEERPGPGAQNYHLVLLAENETGYRNLIKLSTEAHVSGFYRKPRVDHALLERHSDGLICLSGCASGELATLILNDDLAGAEERADWYRGVFEDRYYLELQYHDLDFQSKINGGVVHLSQRLELPLVATNDVHYTEQRQARAQEILLCIQTQTTLADPKRMKMETQEFYLKSPEQMHALFAQYPSALNNTLAIAERCNLELEFGRTLLPTFIAPDGQTSEQYLRSLCEDGLRRRYAGVTPPLRERLEYELGVISTTGFTDYFLLVHDVIHFARRRGIAVGPGRGSAAGSLVAYCLFLTNIDPIGNGLSFERFLNPERVSMPDMDLDFADDRRDEVIRYVVEKYGRDRVAQIITFGTIKPRAGVRDVGRVLGMPYSDVDRVAKLIPQMTSSLEKAKEEVAELRDLYESDPEMKSLLDTVSDLEGVARHASTHAAGVVISRDPLTEHVPLYKVPKSDLVTTQYAMASIEQIGLLKMDFLGLRTLTILERARAFVREATGRDLCLDEISLEDPSIYELLATGETFGIFQLDGSGMRKAIQQVRPTRFEHLVALNALYRPGPMDHIEEFAARKNGEREVKYIHPALEEVLRETFGIVVYQEQVMKIAVLVAGYTMGEGDLLRRAMGKKKKEELAKHRDSFLQRAEERGTSREVSEQLFNIIEPFAGYAFNKAHAAAYSMITCQTAYLKANYPRELMAAFLSAERENAEKVSEAVAECRRLAIPVLGPDVNASSVDFSLEEAGIRFGISAVKHVGEAAIGSIVAERAAGGPFVSLEDFCTRVDWSAVNRRVLESLAKCGAMDSLGVERGRLLASLDRVVSFGTQLRRARESGQVSLFGDVGEPQAVLQLAMGDAATLEQKLEWEQELLGMAVTKHPVIDAETAFVELGGTSVSGALSAQTGGTVRVGGLIRGARSFSTRDGRPMASFTLTDLQANVEAVVFARSIEAAQPALIDGSIVVVDGKLDLSDGRARLLVDAVLTLEQARSTPVPASAKANGNGRRSSNGHIGRSDNGVSNGHSPQTMSELAAPPQRLTLVVERTGDKEQDLARLEAVYRVLQQYSGRDEAEIWVRRSGKLTAIPLPCRTTGYCAELVAALKALLGDDALRLTAVHASA